MTRGTPRLGVGGHRGAQAADPPSTLPAKPSTILVCVCVCVCVRVHVCLWWTFHTENALCVRVYLTIWKLPERLLDSTYGSFQSVYLTACVWVYLTAHQAEKKRSG